MYKRCKKLHKKCKYECIMNTIPRPQGIKPPRWIKINQLVN